MRTKTSNTKILRKKMAKEISDDITVCDEMEDDDLKNYDFKNDPGLKALNKQVLELLEKAPYPGTYVKNGKIYEQPKKRKKAD